MLLVRRISRWTPPSSQRVKAQRISMAASIGDVKGIHKRISIEKQNRRARQCREGSGAAF